MRFFRADARPMCVKGLGSSYPFVHNVAQKFHRFALMLLFSIMKKRALLPFLLAAVSVSLYAQQSSITPESLKIWLTYLSSDELEGRATFSEGLGLAAAYIADQLKQAGVKPGGDHGSYFQRVEVMGIKSTNHSSVTVEVNGQRRTFKDG